MSSLINSLIIEPVVRQAQRFSSASIGVPASEPLSHANPARDLSAVSTPPEQMTLAPCASEFDWRAIAESRVDEDGQQTSGHVVEDSAGVVISQPTISSLRSIQEDRMSVNPQHDVAESLRSADSIGMSDSIHGSVSSVGSISRTAASSAQDGPPPILPHGQHRQYHAIVMSSSLPEHDGLASLREELHQIQAMATSAEDKAKRMHFIMTQDYIAHSAQAQLAAASLTELGGFALPIDPNNPYNIFPPDLELSYAPTSPIPAEAQESMDEDNSPILGCIHYKRNVKVQCFDCHRWFPCRHCHDNSHHLPFPHVLNRKKTQNMLCMLCQMPQPAAETCMNCDELTAWYYCRKCKLWDNDIENRIYHCDDCGICRRGEGLGRDFVHCRRCNVCITINTHASHPCIERATDCDCPLCLLHLFESPSPVVSLPCGHYMHAGCYKDLMAVTYRCPVCNKSAVNMELQWRKLDNEIRVQPMPEDDDELEGLMPALERATGETEQADFTQPPRPPRRPRNVWIGCNDCGGRGWTPFHWLGLKCSVCDSYNTNQMTPTASRETETERLVRQQQHYRQHDFTGNEVLRSAGIGRSDDDEEKGNTSLSVPYSPSQAVAGPAEPRVQAVRAQSPGRSYFLQAEYEEQQQQPRASGIELPRFRPYEMIQRMSRNLSPMRYYLEGLDVRDEEVTNLDLVDERQEPVVEDPPVVRDSREAKSEDVEGGSLGFWGTDGHFLSGEEDHGEDEDASESEDSEPPSDAEVGEDDVEFGKENEDMELFGHR